MQENVPKQPILGTLTRWGGSETIVSSGIPSLDAVLGDGIPTGSLVIIDEDVQGLYSRVMLKYFLAEGVVSKHDVFVASQDIPSEKIIQQLPMLIDSSKPVKEVCVEPNLPRRKMKIAFRYDNLPTDEKEPEQKFGHYYDLSGVMSSDYISNCKITHWNGGRDVPTKSFRNPKYFSLLNSIRDEFKVFDGQNNVLRIGVHSVGSPVWQLSESMDEEVVLEDLCLFLYVLRMMVQTTKAVAFVTIPAHLYEKFDRCLHLSDVYIRLRGFSGTELGDNKYLSNYHGFFYLDKLSAKHGFKSRNITSVEYVFKLRRKKFVIETLHLPPDIDGTDAKVTPSSSCGSGPKLDF